jgi:hypothetical protein
MTEVVEWRVNITAPRGMAGTWQNRPFKFNGKQFLRVTNFSFPIPVHRVTMSIKLLVLTPKFGDATPFLQNAGCTLSSCGLLGMLPTFYWLNMLSKAKIRVKLSLC